MVVVSVVVVVVVVGGAALVVRPAGEGTVATIRVNFAKVGGIFCSPTPILTPIAITLAVPLTLVRACHSTKLLACDVRGCGWMGLKGRCGILGVLYAFCYVLVEVRDRMVIMLSWRWK